MKYKILKLFFIIWIIIWVFFLMKEVFFKGSLREYNVLLHKSPEGKKSYLSGDDLYEFVMFCNNKLPEGASYKFLGLEKDSHDKRRVTYYLYPHLEDKDADFILVFKGQIPAKDAYEMFSGLDKTRYILKKKKKGN